MSQNPSRFLLITLAAFSFACGCATQGVPASGTVLGRPIETRVDSNLAARYLEQFDAAMDAPSQRPPQLAGLPSCSSAKVSAASLKEISERYTVDVAALFAAGCLIDANRWLTSDFHERLARYEGAESATSEVTARELEGLTIAMVPGWDYVESGAETGADFANQRAFFTRLGVENVLVPIDPVGSVEENAGVIRSELAHLATDREKIVVVSASSASPAVALALGSPEASSDLRAVRGWLNIGGILGGVPLIDASSSGFGRFLLGGFAALQGWRIEAMESMSVQRSHERLAELELPDHLVVLNYIGIPLMGDISSRAAFFHQRMRDLGPNDGLTLITDPILPDTSTIVALGQDHFFADAPDLEARTVALASLVASAVRERELHASRGLDASVAGGL